LWDVETRYIASLQGFQHNTNPSSPTRKLKKQKPLAKSAANMFGVRKKIKAAANSTLNVKAKTMMKFGIVRSQIVGLL
jgi:hypothetical protein